MTMLEKACIETKILYSNLHFFAYFSSIASCTFSLLM